MEPSTKDRLLDAAERLFALEGYHATSLRSITTAAGANLASVNYHFGSKERLIEAVLERRLMPLNELRQQNLERVRSEASREGRRPGVREVLAAFVEPTLRFREGGAGNRHFITLVGRVLAEPDDTVRNMFMRLIRPLFYLLYDTLALALPQVDRNTLFWRLHFALGAVSHTLCWAGRFRELPPEMALPDGLQPVEDADELNRLLIDFLAPGLELT